MIIKKITHGFVIQQFDTEKQAFVAQEFVAGDNVELEVDNPEHYDNIEDSGIDDYYLPFHMEQP